MRCITMQSKEVVDILQSGLDYVADITKVRCSHAYKEDMEQLGGAVPIWIYIPYGVGMSRHTMVDGGTLQGLHCEMSLRSRNTFDKFFMLEIEVEGNPPMGIAHNSSAWVRVIPKITPDMVKAVYTVRDSKTKGWYFKDIFPYCMIKDDCTFPCGFIGDEEYEETEFY